MRRRSRAVAGVLSLLVAALCAAPGAAGAQAVKIRMGTPLSPPALDAITPYVALERGLFKKYGLDVQIVEFRGGPTNVKALLAGEVDVSGILGTTDAILAASKGAKIRAWMVLSPITPFHFVARRQAATTLQGLIGRSVGVSGINTLSHHIPRIVLERSGVDPDKVKYVAVGSPADRFKALLTGKVDAAMVLNTEAAKLAQHPEIVNLVSVPKILPELPYNFFGGREDYAEKTPETVVKLTVALLEANRYIATNKAGTLEVAAKVLKDEPADVLSRAYDLADPRLWGVNGEMTESAYQTTVEWLLKVGYLKDAVPFEKLFDRRFLDRALKELGRL